MPKLLYLEGLRGVAALMVLFLHLQLGFYSYLYADLARATQHWPGGLGGSVVLIFSAIFDGRLAVRIFWVLSAYVICLGLFRAGPGRANLIGTAAKRYFRLLGPCAVSVLVVFGLARFGYLFHSALPEGNYWLDPYYQIVPNLYLALKSAFWSVYFSVPQPFIFNPPLWSIKGEMYGSLFCFALFGVLGQSPRRFMAYPLVLLVLLLLKIPFLLCFFVGFVLCDYDHSVSQADGLGLVRRAEKWIFQFPVWAEGLFWLTVLGGKYLLLQVGVTNDPANVVMSALLVYLVLRVGAVQSLLSAKPLVWLGKISFSLYLLHVPVLFSLGCWLYLKYPPLLGESFWVCVVVTVVSLGLAALFQRWVDAPSVRLARWVSQYFSGQGVGLSKPNQP
jgi:peptidoglycan/LPS O-acetylase OafA/YrhL